MDSKLLILISFLTTSILTTQTASQAVTCAFQDSRYSVPTRGINNVYYTCALTHKNTNHKTGRTDNDIRYLFIPSTYPLPYFWPIYCQKFQNLEVIKTVDAQIESFDDNALAYCGNLKFLNLNGNKIRQLPDYLFYRNQQLKHIRMWNCQLTTLPENLFLSQQLLDGLDLGENQIYFLPSNVFHPLTELRYLFLNKNQIRAIDPAWFTNLYNLLELTFNNNEITSIQANAFAPLRNLQKLWLYENKIASLSPDSFIGLQNLHILELESNEISELPKNVFVPLRNLMELQINDTRLSTIHSDSFGVHSYLTRLYLGGNRINAVDEKVIDNTAVWLLNMTGNVCTNLLTHNRNEIKVNLRTCFENYRPRAQATHDRLPRPQFNSQKTSQIQMRVEHSDGSCGKRSSEQASGNIIGGTRIVRGSFPWIAAIVRHNGRFFCGGTLVSDQKVVTAAHCIQEKESAAPTLAREMIVLLGAHDLENLFEPGRIPYAVRHLQMHPEWNPFTQSFDADIAVLVLDMKVVFNTNIQPICLIPPGSNIATIGSSIVVGFGKSEDPTKIHENIPKVISNPIVSNQMCFGNNPGLKKISSGRTFCGGHATGIGVCRGDSGSGVFVEYNGAYYLRGIVSSSLTRGPYGCDVDTYAVFTDVTKFYEWINKIPLVLNGPLRK